MLVLCLTFVYDCASTVLVLMEGCFMTELLKYPRTPHLPCSLGMTSDDKMISSEGLAFLRDGSRELVVTEKMDGSNYTMTNSVCFSRSVDARSNHWDNYVKQVWARVRFDIPPGWRVTGENMYARKSVPYDNLRGVFLVFGVWDEDDNLLSWDDMGEYASLLGLPVVRLLYRGYDFGRATRAWGEVLDDEVSEGFVLRSADVIPVGSFGERVAKFVRTDHVRTEDSWRHRDDYELNTFRHI